MTIRRQRRHIDTVLARRLVELMDQLEALRPRHRGRWWGSFTMAGAEAEIAKWKARQQAIQEMGNR